MRKQKKSLGFTLLELLIVVIILALIAGFYSPAYQQKIAKEKRTDAIAGLEDLQHAQELFRANCPQYATAISTLESSCDPVKGYKLLHKTLSPKENYTLTIIAPTVTTPTTEAGKSYTLLAVPIENDRHCLSFTLNQDNNKGATHSDCWDNASAD